VSGARPKFDSAGLVPAVVQDARTGQVLMVAWMNEESFDRTLATGRTHFWSRSRKELWEKGATSGNTQEVVEVLLDCDRDTVLVKVRPAGPACHTGSTTCFSERVLGTAEKGLEFLLELENLVADRREHPVAGSYTNYLFEKGLDKILKKVGEESAEVIIAAKNRVREEVIYETSDLIYHLLVMLCEQKVNVSEIVSALALRHQKRTPKEPSESIKPGPQPGA